MSAEIARSAEMDRPTKQLWAAILGSAAAFVAVGSIGWLIAGVTCTDQTPDLGPLSQAGVRVLIGVIAAAGLLVTARGVQVGRRYWTAHSTDHTLSGLEDAAGQDRYRFLAVVAILTSGIFLLGVLWEGLPAVFLDVCESIR